jgi:hypothetical protein
MPRPLKAKTLVTITATRDRSTYQLQIEDEAGKKALFGLTSDQAHRLADVLDNLLADEEDELHPKPAPSSLAPSTSAESLGIVKWYNTTKGFGFVTPEAGGEEVFLHRTVLEELWRNVGDDGVRRAAYRGG